MAYAKAVESLNYQLDDLDIDGTARFTEADLEGKEPSNPAFMETCNALVKCLKAHDSTIKNDSFRTIGELYSCLSYRPLAFRNDSAILQYNILHYLCTSLQAKRIQRRKINSELKCKTAAESGKLYFQLDKICKCVELEVDGVTGDSATEVTEATAQRLNAIYDMHPDLQDRMKDPATIVPKVELTPAQIKKLDQVSQFIHHDFTVRRHMLVKRLDVTIQSFLWGQRNLKNQSESREEELLAAIQAQRECLQIDPVRHGVSDVFAAPVSLLHEHTKKITGSQSGKGSLVKNVIIGSVPDRGGRAGEMRVKPEFNSHGGGGKGYGVGGRGGDKGRGGRGGGGKGSHGGGSGRGGGGGGGGGGNKQADKQAGKQADKQAGKQVGSPGNAQGKGGQRGQVGGSAGGGGRSVSEGERDRRADHNNSHNDNKSNNNNNNRNKSKSSHTNNSSPPPKKSRTVMLG